MRYENRDEMCSGGPHPKNGGRIVASSSIYGDTFNLISVTMVKKAN